MNWIVYALLAVAFASVRNIAQKSGLQQETIAPFLAVRSLYLSGFSLLLLPWLDRTISPTGVALCALVGLVATIAMLSRSTAVKHMDISTVQPLFNLFPLVVALIAFIFLGEALTPLQIGGIVLLVTGTYILELDEEHQGMLGPFRHVIDAPYTQFVFLSLLCFAITSTLDRYVLTTYTDPYTYLFLVHVFVLIYTTMYNWYTESYALFDTDHHQWSTIANAATYFCFLLALYHAFSLAYAGLVAAVVRLQSLTTTIEGGLFFHEDHLVKKTIACAIMVAGTALVVL